jgi:hypothetical protein
LPDLLEAAFLPWVEADKPVPVDSDIRAAWDGLFAWLSGPVTTRRRSEPWNVVIVPGNRSDLSLRVQLAADLIVQSSARREDKILLFSGSHPRYEDEVWDSIEHLPIGEAEAMAWYYEGLPMHSLPTRIAPKIDSRATTTEETFGNAIGHIRALHAARVARAGRDPAAVGLPLVVVATSPYHVLRAHLLANRTLAGDINPLVSGPAHVMECPAMYGRELILDGVLNQDPTDYGGPKDVHPRLYGARVFIQEALKVAGGRAAGVF